MPILRPCENLLHAQQFRRDHGPGCSHSEPPRTALPIDRRQRFVRAFSQCFLFFVWSDEILQTHSLNSKLSSCPRQFPQCRRDNARLFFVIDFAANTLPAHVAGPRNQRGTRNSRNGGVFRQGDFALARSFSFSISAFGLDFFSSAGHTASTSRLPSAI